MEAVVRTVCQSCHSECGVLAYVEDGRVVRLQGDPHHPNNKGYICVKGKAEPGRLYHPERLLHPLKRIGERGQGRWQRVPWDEALNGIAAGLHRGERASTAPKPSAGCGHRSAAGRGIEPGAVRPAQSQRHQCGSAYLLRAFADRRKRHHRYLHPHGAGTRLRELPLHPGVRGPPARVPSAARQRSPEGQDQQRGEAHRRRSQEDTARPPRRTCGSRCDQGPMAPWSWA